MKKGFALALAILLLVFTTACSNGDSRSADVAAIMVNDKIYLYSVEPSPSKVDKSAIVGYAEYYTETHPNKNFETNLSRKLGLAVAEVKDGIAVLVDNEWHICSSKTQPQFLLIVPSIPILGHPSF